MCVQYIACRNQEGSVYLAPPALLGYGISYTTFYFPLMWQVLRNTNNKRKKAWTLFDSDVVVIVNTSFLAEMGESPPILSQKYMFISQDEIWSIMICLLCHNAYFQLCSKYLKKYICYSFLPGNSSSWKSICFEVCQLCSYARGLSVVAISANYVLLGPSPTYYAPLKTRVT